MQVHTRRHELDAVVGDIHIVASRNRTEPVEARSSLVESHTSDETRHPPPYSEI